MTQRNVVLSVSGLLIAVSLLSILWFVPEWQGGRLPSEVGAKDRAELVNAYRTTLAQALAGVGLLGGLYFTWRNLMVAREGQITERYTEAITQLGDQNPAVRTGAMYALERIRVEISGRSLADRRSADGIRPPGSSMEPTERRHTAFPAAFRHTSRSQRLARRKWRQTETRRISLVNTDLRGAYLADAHFEGAYLPYTHLEEAVLDGAHFQRVDLSPARLTAAELLKGTDLDLCRFRLAIWLTGETERIQRRLLMSRPIFPRSCVCESARAFCFSRRDTVRSETSTPYTRNSP